MLIFNFNLSCQQHFFQDPGRGHEKRVEKRVENKVEKKVERIEWTEENRFSIAGGF